LVAGHSNLSLHSAHPLRQGLGKVREKAVKGTAVKQVLTERASSLSAFYDHEPPYQSGAAAADASESFEGHLGTILADRLSSHGPKGGQTQKELIDQRELAQVAPSLVNDHSSLDQNASMQNFQQSTSPAAHGPSKIKHFSKGNANKVKSQRLTAAMAIHACLSNCWHKFSSVHECRDHSQSLCTCGNWHTSMTGYLWRCQAVLIAMEILASLGG
jgi:hypothetical protein